MKMRADDPRAVALVEAVRAGDVGAVEHLLADHGELATARFVDPRCGDERSALHLATDWPGHFPNGRAVVATLVEAGADVDASFGGRHAERPLHWAASSDDVEVLDALVEAGADLEAPGSVINGCSPLADAVAFGQWRAARRLVELGAQANLWHAAALGLADCGGHRLDRPRRTHLARRGRAERCPRARRLAALATSAQRTRSFVNDEQWRTIGHVPG